ncbi:MAG: methyltransferase domain-containing protein [Microbacteriaceae bacterium]
MRCDYFDAGLCRSCTLMGTPYPEQLAGKLAHARALLADWPEARWLEPVASEPEAFRTKAKMVVGGTVDAPTLGILGPDRSGVDLRDCGVIAPGIRAAFAPLAAFVGRARIAPYDVGARRGELKHLVLLEAPDGALMVRFVLRSREAESRIRAQLPWLLRTLPAARVVSINLQPEHKAVIEGEEELVLTAAHTLPLRLERGTLAVRPGSFVQTNTAVATALYRQAGLWARRLAPTSVWDLYCGSGGFALHVAGPGRRVVGVELSAAAVEGARAVAPAGCEFVEADATEFAERADPAERPELVIVNPPRRGLGTRLAAWLEDHGPAAVLYSSCNAVSLERDLRAMPSYRPGQLRLFDMFPQTEHYEIAALLLRTPAR